MKRCGVCSRSPEERQAIEDGLLRNTPLRTLAHQFGCSHYVLHRHRLHLPARLTLAKHAEEVVAAGTLLARLEDTIAECRAIVVDAKKQKNLQAANGALANITRNLQLLGQLTGELHAASANVRIGITHNTLNVHSVESLSETDLEIEIARSVGEATSGFDPKEFERLRLLVEQPILIDGTLGLPPDVPADDVSQQ
jgi:hypothetical protein